MDFTYVGEWIDNYDLKAPEERMIADLTYIYENYSEFENWLDFYNDGCDIYCIATGKSDLDIIEGRIALLING